VASFLPALLSHFWPPVSHCFAVCSTLPEP